MIKDKTLYDRLGVLTDASESQIKNAFIQLSKKWHPDKNNEEMKIESEKKFKEIKEAKEILLDSHKRQLYDQIGMEILNQNRENPFPNSFPGGFPGGFHGGFHGKTFMKESFLQPINVNINVTLEQIYKEESFDVSFTFQKDCSSCKGEGGQTEYCSTCNGKGKQIHIQQMGPIITQQIIDCEKCKGIGKRIIEECKKCNKGVVERIKKILIPLSSSLVSENKIHIKNQGHQHHNLFSDLIITVTIEPHSIFIQRNQDLIVKVELTLFEAIFGFTKRIKHLDDSHIILHSDKKTDYYQIECVPKRGMNQNGNLYIVYTISIPTLDELDHKEILKDILPEQIEKEMYDKTPFDIEMIHYLMTNIKLK